MIIACVKTFNGEDFIAEAVASIYNHVDKVIIADCCFDAMAKIVHPSRIGLHGLSAAEARATIKAIPDPESKITVWDIGFLNGEQTIIYNEFVNHADVGDAIWLLDDDEIYSEPVAAQLEAWIREERYHAVWLPSRIYWHDFYHIRPDHGQLAHQRIYVKLDESCHYVERNLDVRWLDAQGFIYGYGKPPKKLRYKGIDYQTFVGTISGENEMWYYHYAYVRTTQRMLEKCVSQYIQNVEPEEGDEWRHCQKYRDPIEFKVETYPWFTNHDSENVQKSDEWQPLENHKWSTQHWNEDRIAIDYEQARGLLGWKPPINVNTVNIGGQR